MVGLDVRRPILSREQRNDPVLGSTPHNCFRGLLFPPLAPPFIVRSHDCDPLMVLHQCLVVNVVRSFRNAQYRPPAIVGTGKQQMQILYSYHSSLSIVDEPFLEDEAVSPCLNETSTPKHWRSGQQRNHDVDTSDPRS